MSTSVCKLTARSIRTFFGRYVALVLIVMLSVGFFSGLKVTRSAMAATCDTYLSEQNFHDYRLISTTGFGEDEVERLGEISGVKLAEGSKSSDAVITYNGADAVFHLLSMPERINLPSLTAGRMPETETECLADARYFSEDDIGSVVQINTTESEDVRISQTAFTIVGLANSPLYLGSDRGSSTLGSGEVVGFIYLPASVFDADAYTEVFLTLSASEEAYSEEYELLIEETKAGIEKELSACSEERYESLLQKNGLTKDQAAAAGMEEPQTCLLTREDNTGYVSFENDTSIVSGIANIFPFFFILIAMLVCITTMTRMVDEERTQIGVLKAMGYSNAQITAKYLLYAGSATVVGWAAGFFAGTWGLPKVFWFAYSSLYDFASLQYQFQPGLAAATLSAALIGILGSTWWSCRKEFSCDPAKLIRPRAPKAGKRVFLERFSAIWKRLSFLDKVSLRNMLRYKKRLFMMLIGIGCCAGLVLTAFGVRDSMIDIGTLHFEQVQRYDLQASVSQGSGEAVCQTLNRTEGIGSYTAVYMERVSLSGQDTMNSVNLLCTENEAELLHFWSFHDGDTTVDLPGQGEAIVGSKVAEKLALCVGDSFEIRKEGAQTLRVEVSGVFDCYVDNYIVISEDTYREAFGDYEANTILITAEGGAKELSETLNEMDGITEITRLSDTQNSVDSALSCLNYIIWLIVLFSGALAFIVILNLTSINLAERSREVATVEVLGFYPKETERYILRENLILSLIAGVIGLPLGLGFHHMVMSMIKIDTMTFRNHISPVSYVAALACTLLFAYAANLFMKHRIGRIQMAESLKAVE